MIKAQTVNDGVEVELQGLSKEIRNELTAILFKVGKENPAILMQSVDVALDLIAENTIKNIANDNIGFTGLKKGSKDA